MGLQNRERPAVLVIDMVKDNFDEKRNIPITHLARRLIEPINRLALVFRGEGWPVIFATDAFHGQDFIFSGKLSPHSLAGTTGAEVIDELDRQAEDLWLPKPRFSAFFKTGLDEWLRKRAVTLCAVAGITTNFCVLTTVMDAICFDFEAVLLEDCTAAASENIHKHTLSIYRRNVLYPLLKVAESSQWIDEVL